MAVFLTLTPIPTLPRMFGAGRSRRGHGRVRRWRGIRSLRWRTGLNLGRRCIFRERAILGQCTGARLDPATATRAPVCARPRVTGAGRLASLGCDRTRVARERTIIGQRTCARLLSTKRTCAPCPASPCIVRALGRAGTRFGRRRIFDRGTIFRKRTRTLLGSVQPTHIPIIARPRVFGTRVRRRSSGAVSDCVNGASHKEPEERDQPNSPYITHNTLVYRSVMIPTNENSPLGTATVQSSALVQEACRC